MRIINFYQNLSYCRTCKRDGCNHNNKPLGFWSARAAFFENLIRVEWNVGRHNNLCIECEWLDGDGCRDVKFRLGLPFLFTLYLTFEDILPKSIQEPWKKGPRQAGINWNPYGQYLKINLGGKSHESSSKDKWWEKGFTFHAPWDNWHLSTEILDQDGTSVWIERSRNYWQRVFGLAEHLQRNGMDSIREQIAAGDAHSKTYPYRYVLKNGTEQNVEAKCHIERRTWCRRWFPFWKRSVTSLSVNSSSEVGEGSGSYKGGCVGCGIDMLPGETMEAALRRMEATRKFDQ